MAVISMTGFGNASHRQPSVEIEVSIKTFNSKFFEIRSHLPREYLPYEPEIKALLKRTFGRGTIDVFIHRRPGQQSRSKRVVFHESILRDYVAAIPRVQKIAQLQGPISLSDVLSANGVFTIEENNSVVLEERSPLMSTVTKATQKAFQTRQREGQMLAKELLRLLKTLDRLAKAIQMRVERTQKARSLQAQKRIEAATQSGQIDASQLAQELSAQLEKSDVQEEIVRFQAHISYCLDLLKAAASPGKSLEFYSQELLREINTIGSKVASAEISHLVVQTKTAIDQLKEQVLNIE